MLASDGDYKLRTFHNGSGEEIPQFPKTTRSFWLLDCGTVERLLNDLSIDHGHCQTEDDRLRELGMHIGVHPDSNPRQKTIDKKIDELQEHVSELKGQVTAVKASIDKLLHHLHISLVKIQRWALRCITARRVKSLKTRLTIAMSLHGRLGAASPIRGFDSDVMQMIFGAL